VAGWGFILLILTDSDTAQGIRRLSVAEVEIILGRLVVFERENNCSVLLSIT